MDNAVVADLAALINLHAGIDDGVFAYADIVSEIDLRVDFCIVLYLHILLHDCAVADIYSLADDRGFVYYRLFAYAQAFRFELVVKLQKGHKGLFWILHADERAGDRLLRFEILGDNCDACLGVVKEMCVFLVSEEGQTLFRTLVNLAETLHHGIRVTLDDPFNELGDLFGRKCGYLCHSYKKLRVSSLVIFWQ